MLECRKCEEVWMLRGWGFKYVKDDGWKLAEERTIAFKS